jgi:hypothetical protein
MACLQERAIVTFLLTQFEDEKTHEVTAECVKMPVGEITMLPNTKEQYRSRAQPRVGWRVSAVHIAAMADLDDLDDPRCVVYRVDDSVGPLADAVPFLFSGELLAAGWARRLRETLDAGGDPDADPAWLHRFELLGGGGLDEDVITCHAAEEP